MGKPLNSKAEFICTWWERTEKMTPFIDGISSPILRSVDTGKEVSSRDLPVGALYFIPRAADAGPNDHPYVGACDGKAVACKMWDYTWYIDNRASNCTKPTDKEHRCWVRHGTMGDKLTVDKNGLTCQAGAGSVYMDNKRWHGFLRKGVLAP